MKRMLLRLASVALIAVVACGLAACDGGASPADQPAQTAKPADAPRPAKRLDEEEPWEEEAIAFDHSLTAIVPFVQEYGEDVVEILRIDYDAASAANEGIEALNADIEADLVDQLDSFMANRAEDQWLNLRSYPISSADYLQIISTVEIYDHWSVENGLFSYVFDLDADQYVTLDMALDAAGLSAPEMADAVENHPYFTDLLPVDMQVYDIAPVGFFMTVDRSPRVTQFFIQVIGDLPEYGEITEFLTYTPEWDELLWLDPYRPVDELYYDVMEPPLQYGMAFSYALAFDTQGLEEVGEDEYLLDGLVYFRSTILPSVAFDEGEVAAQIANAHGEPIDLINLTLWSEDSGLSYPAWLVVYNKGGNEDTSLCTDLYVQTEEVDYWFHTSVPVDYELDYHDEIGRRLATVCFAQ